MKIKFLFRKAITLLSLAAFCFAYSPASLAAGLPPISLAQMYSYASSGNVRALRAAVQRGLNIDSRDRFGNTGLCHAILQNDCTAYNAFRASGANPHSSCIQNIPQRQYDRFMEQSCTADIDDTPRQAYNKFNEGEFIIAKRTWIIGGILLAGGLVALLAGGGGGGGGNAIYFVPYSEPDDSLAKYVGTKAPNSPETSPYKPITYFADNNKTITNQADGAQTNDFTVSNNSSVVVPNANGGSELQQLVNLIDLNGNILDYAVYLKVGMKARNNSSVINGSEDAGSNAPMITIGEASVGMAADDYSQATNYGTLKILAQNGAFGMIAGNHSVATNQSGDINLQFKGFNNQDTIIGMYADTYSSILNFGNITGNTIDVSGSTGGSGTSGDTTTTANAGTIIGMEVRTINEVPYPSLTPAATASNNANITLNAQSDSAAIKTSLIGMGGYLDQDFLDGTKLIRRASSLYLTNTLNGNISLNYTLSGTGTYAPDENTLLMGNGGIVGMRADAKTTALNEGNISLLLSTGVDNAGAGMQAVHGGTISNENIISVVGGMGNYGMLSVRGQGNNSEIDALAPTLTNAETGIIEVTSTDGFGMASFNGGKVTNNGTITMQNDSTGMRTNTGILTNSEGANITLQNSGAGMVLKSGDPTTDSQTSGSDSADGSGDTSTGESGAAIKQNLTNAQAINNGTITIYNADGAQGIFIEDGTATNNGTNGAGIFVSNTSRVPTEASYGIQAQAGNVINNGTIDMNVLVSTDGSTSVDSYGIFSDSANITNTADGSITFHKRGTGIATTSGYVQNLGNITLEQGGTGISSSNGDVLNATDASIIINDNDTAASTGIVAQAGKITNNGTITITNGNGATGIKAGLLVDNNNIIDLSGRNVTGIELTGQDAIANNNATININSTYSGENNYGIKASASAVNANITNNNNITLTGSVNSPSYSQQGYGISIAGGTATNLGTITFDNMYGWGMYTTAGTIKNDNGTILMNAGGTGLYGNGADALMVNSGDITIDVPDNDNNSISYGIYADGGAIANNTADANIYINSNASTASMLTQAFGIYVNQGEGTNLGNIFINGSNSTGMAYAGSDTTGSLTNMQNAVINLTGSNNIGMTSAGATAKNNGTINIGTIDDEGTLTASSDSIGMQTTGGAVFNQGVINVNSNDSVGLQSDAETGTITNNGTINVSETATNSYAILSNSGTAINGVSGIINSNQSNTDLMKSLGGSLTNYGSLNINSDLSNVNAMHIQGTGTATNAADATINVGTGNGATGSNNIGMFVDGGSVVNEGNINVYTQDSYAIKLINNTGDLVNNGTISIMEGADGSVALYAQNGDIYNKGTINMFGEGILMQAINGQTYNEGTIALGDNATGIVVSGTNNADNSGTLSVNGNNSTAFLIQGTGTVTNQQNGVINVLGSNSYGFKADDGFAATLVNNGEFTLEGDGSNSFAMYGQSANITNTATIDVLQSSSTAMFTSVGKLLNTGNITLDGENSVGLSVQGGGSAIHGNEDGTDTEDTKTYIAVNAAGAQGMSASGSGSLTNNALINVNASGAYGMYGSGGSSLTNNDNIYLNGGGYGMYATGSVTNAQNKNNISATINSGLNGSLYALYSTSSGSVTNALNATISLSGNPNAGNQIFGVYTNGGSANNNGTININGSNMSAMGIGTSGGTLNNVASGVINLSGSNLTGMNVSGGNAYNLGDINIGTDNSAAPNSVGINVTGGNASNQGDINVNSADSVALQSNGGSVTNIGIITISDNATGSLAFLSNSGNAINASTGTVNLNQSDTDIMKAMGGNITNNGTLNTAVSASNVNAMHVANGGNATNTKTINVGTSTAASGTNNVGILIDGTAASTASSNSGTISVYSDDSYGVLLDNQNASFTNSGTISVDGGASGSIALYAEQGKITNSSSGVINMSASGVLMQTRNGTIINQADIDLSFADSIIMNVTGSGTAQNSGKLTVDTVDSYAMKVADGVTATLTNTGTINLNNGATGSYAMYGANANITNSGNISVLQSGATALFTKVGSLVNNGSITLNALNSIGLSISGSGGTAENASGGSIILSNSGKAMSVSGASEITNNGTIQINANNAYALFASNGGTATNNKAISIGDSYSGSYAMYGTTNSTLKNNSNITVGQASSAAIYATDSTITNAGTLTVNSAQNNAAGIYATNTTGGGNITNTGSIDVNYKGSTSSDNVYGIYANSNSGITVSNTNTIDVSSDKSNAYGIYSSSAVQQNNRGNITVRGLSAYGMYGGVINTTDGQISVTGTGTGASYGIFGTGGNVSNQSDIIVNAAQGYGINMNGSGTLTNSGDITLNLTGSGTSYGLYGGSLTNGGVIKVTGTASGTANGTAYGIYSTGGTVQNSSEIDVSAEQGYGIALNGSGTATNKERITLTGTDSGTSYGMYGSNGASLVNSAGGTISVNAANATGMYATGDGTLTNSGNITVTGMGNGTSYGMYGGVINTTGGKISVTGSGAGYSYGIFSNGNYVSNMSDIIVSAAQGYGINMNNGGILTNGGNINLNLTGNGTSYGLYGGGLTNDGALTITGSGNGISYGMYSTGGTVLNRNNISVSDGQAYGIVLNGSGTATNSGTITVTGKDSRTSYGMYGSNGASLVNSAESSISVNGTTANATGMFVTGSGTATNSGTITVTGSSSGTSYGMYASSGASLVNAAGATINVNGTNAVGMYATGSGSSITNYGNIILNGASISTEYPGASSSTNPDTDNTGCTAAGCGNFIQVANGATFVNSGQVISTSALNFNLMSAANSGTFVLAPKGSYIAPEHSGPVTASADIVMEGNKTTYVNEDSFIGTDAGLKLSSGSYLFDAYLVTNEDGNQDVVMIMKEFSDVVDNSSVANFLTNNYTLGTNMDMYSILKSAPDASSFTAAVAGQMGLDIVPSFAKQNMDIVKAVNRHMSQTLFANQSAQDVRAMFDFVYDYREQNDVDMLSGYEDEALSAYAMFDRKYNSNFRYGLGVSFTRYESDYDNGSERDEIIAQVLTPLIYTTEGLKAIAMPRLGIGWGEYNRRADGFDNKADTKNYYYGITNEVRKEFDLGAVVLEPTAEFNVLGMYQDSTKEKNGLEVKSANNLSVEGGLGLYARKSFSIKDENDLTLRAGGTWYHEFNNPYQAARARIAGMVGSYQMDSYDAERDRGILTFRMDYKHEGFDFYFEANKFLEESDGYALSAGMGYKF